MLATVAGLLVLAMLLELDRDAAAESLLGLVTALLVVVGWLAWMARARVLRRAGRRRDDAIGAALDGTRGDHARARSLRDRARRQ